MYFADVPAGLSDFETEALEALRRLLDDLRPQHVAPSGTMAEREATLYLEIAHSSLPYRVTLMVEPEKELTVYFNPPAADPPLDVDVGGDLEAALSLIAALLRGSVVLETRSRGKYERIVVVDGDTRDVAYSRGSLVPLLIEKLFPARNWHEHRLPSFV